MNVEEPVVEEAPSEERRKPKASRLKKRLIVYGALLAIGWGAYVWQPLEIEVLPRPIPTGGKRVDLGQTGLFNPGGTVAVVVAHPDDSEYYLGSLLVKLNTAGVQLHQVVITDGAKDYYPFFDSESLAKVRRGEQTTVSKEWGASPVYLGFADGRIRSDGRTTKAVTDALRKIRPQFVITTDSDYSPKIAHQDHKRTGDIVVKAATELNIPTVVFCATRAPNAFADVTNTWPEHRRLLAFHKSQFGKERLDKVIASIAAEFSEGGDRAGTSFAVPLRVVRP